MKISKTLFCTILNTVRNHDEMIEKVDSILHTDMYELYNVMTPIFDAIECDEGYVWSDGVFDALWDRDIPVDKVYDIITEYQKDDGNKRADLVEDI